MRTWHILIVDIQKMLYSYMKCFMLIKQNIWGHNLKYVDLNSCLVDLNSVNDFRTDQIKHSNQLIKSFWIEIQEI